MTEPAADPDSRTGDPTRATSAREPGSAGYDALRERAALLGVRDRAFLEVRGSSAREHFGGLLTNHVEGLEAGEGAYAFMLTARGRPVAEMRVLVRELGDEEVLAVDLPSACLDPAMDHLGRFLPPRLASFVRMEGLRRIGVVGPRAEEVLRGMDVPRPEKVLGHRTLPADGPLGPGRIARREEIEGPGFDLYLPEESTPAALRELEEAVSAVDGAVADAGDWNVWRVERGLPIYGAEIHPDVLPQETDQQDRAVDFEKGCYTGQEVVARIHYRGKVNRRLRGVRMDAGGGTLPDPGTELYADGRARGSVTSAVRSPRLGPIALAYVRREVETGDELALGAEDGPPARVVELPFEGA